MTDWLPLGIALLSVSLRVVGVGYSALLLYRVRDLRFGFLTLMLTLMAVRQALTLSVANPGIEELPGLIVSGLAVLTVYYLSQYVRQEERTKARLTAKNDQLRGFRKAIRHVGHGIFITDTDGTIEYANPAVETLTGYDRDEVIGENPRMWKSGEHDGAFYEAMWETIADGDVWEGEIVNERKDGERCWVDMTIAPITDESGDIERFVAVDTDVTERKERQQRIEHQNEMLQRLNTTNRILRDVNQALVQAESRGEIERAVCAEFADAEPYSLAWIGTRNMVNDSLRASRHAGIDSDAIGAIVDAHNHSDAEDLLREAIRTESPQVLQEIDDPDQRWQAELASRGYRSVAAVPLIYDGTVYGGLEIASTEPWAFEAIDTSVLVDLGRTIAYAINATESKQALLADSVVELEFQLSGTDGLGTLARALDADATLERLTRSPDGHLVAYATLTGCPRTDVEAAIDDVPAIADAAFVCDHDDGGLFRLDLTDESVESTFLDHGGVVTSQTVEDGSGRLTVEFPRRTDVRSLVESVTASHDGIDLLARREHERSVRTDQEIRSQLESELTDRQLEALRTAYLGGFFEWPRENTGEDIAELMGVSQTTFLQHLRTAQRKTFALLLDDNGTTQSVTARPS
ncbi:bacterio-opsin activator domain-containing protein [Halapricum hydrolyticum]|uniref:PAS domain S-box protein n=1 Tax=Halapricum hydrolyticum TaxID=2979991 RepID=A0AAE3IB38_9EURY|nr:bacterio-opsin activator domain-containing protein [Halapricum hydrolyticum]MCU4718271.1 PAS domain S-box protein [Halapricum hydrolyticum]MCU4727281.1 PAS domain S-box protein [Halapricum hydrolyticum]